MINKILIESKRYLGLLLGWGRVYRYLGCLLEIVGEPAATDFIEDFTNNFTIHVGARSPTYLPPIDKLSKPVPTLGFLIATHPRTA